MGWFQPMFWLYHPSNAHTRLFAVGSNHSTDMRSDRQSCGQTWLKLKTNIEGDQWCQLTVLLCILQPKKEKKNLGKILAEKTAWTACTVQVCHIRSVMFPGQHSHWLLWYNPQINLIIWSKSSKSSCRSGYSTSSSPIVKWETRPQNQV